MPDAAIRTGDVDQVLEPKRMPNAILAFVVDPEAGSAPARGSGASPTSAS